MSDSNSPPAKPPAPAHPPPLQGGSLVLGTIALSLAVFMNVLDSSIANVSIPAISGDLGVSPQQGTWVITSFAVANAISVPLTGWLTMRVGQVRLFVTSIILFVISSWMCGMAPSISMLIAARVIQGAVAGPMIPLSQSLILGSYPPAKSGMALAFWGMTTLVAPIMGPLLGGWISDNYTWPWIFYINIPIGIFAAWATWGIYHKRESVIVKRPIDKVGLGLIVLWVGSLQLMLDKGKELDWFGSPVIVMLAVVAAIAFACFLIWELTDEHPIVDLRVFRHRGFTGAVITIAITYGVFFASILLVPLWLQTNMGYTASWAGYTTALGGIMAVVMSPIVPRLMGRIDARALVSFGVASLAVIALWRSHFASNASYWTIAVTFLIQGISMPFFFIPTTQISLSAVLPSETASAAGLQNFLRTLSAAFCGALTTTMWDNAAGRNHANMAGALNDPQGVQRTLGQMGMTPDQALAQIENLTQSQAVMLATDQMFLIMTVAFAFAACAVWLSPKPNLFAGQAGAGGH